MCAQMHEGSHDDSTLFFFPLLFFLFQKYESYRFEGDPNEVGHVVTTRCTTREDARDVR